MDWRETPATLAIAGLTVAVSAVLLLVGGDQAVLAGGFIPARLSAAVVAGTAATGGAVLVPVWLTPLSATLLHGGWVHLGFNVVMLVFCGRESERALGSANIVLLYLLGAYAAAAGQWVQDPTSLSPTIGASGAISALVAAYALLYGRSRARAIGPLPAGLIHALWLGAAWIAINILMGLTYATSQPIAVGAHIGGFLVGLALARPLLLWRYRNA